MQQSFLILFFWDLLSIPTLKSPYLCCAYWCKHITLLGNSILISVSVLDSDLHTPMCFFLSNLSCLDIWYTSSALTPKLANFISGKNTVSFSGACRWLHIGHTPSQTGAHTQWSPWPERSTSEQHILRMRWCFPLKQSLSALEGKQKRCTRCLNRRDCWGRST